MAKSPIESFFLRFIGTSRKIVPFILQCLSEGYRRKARAVKIVFIIPSLGALFCNYFQITV